VIALYAADGCPFAHRTRALLTQLEQPFELHTIDLANKPADFLALSPNGKVPLLVDGELKLYESFILSLYVAEKFNWTPAFSSDVGVRARQRLGMLQFDELIVSAFYRSLSGDPIEGERRDTIKKALNEIERTVEKTGGVDNLFGYHCATHWVRMGWLKDESPLMPIIEEHVSLTEWLDDAAALPAVQATLPDRAKSLTAIRAKFGKRGA
jgi:glutathione S-transferase